LHNLFLWLSAPLFAVRVFGTLSNFGVPACQQERIWITNFGLDYA